MISDPLVFREPGLWVGVWRVLRLRLVIMVSGMEKAPYAAFPPAEAPPTVLAALGPKMLQLAATKTKGAHPYFTTPEHTAMARKTMGPDAWLCVEQKVLLETDPVKARNLARLTAGIYLGLENYRNNWKRLGFADSDFANGGSDRFIDATVAWGDISVLQKRVRAHLDAGASHVCIQPIYPDGSPAATGEFSKRSHRPRTDSGGWEG